MKRHRLLVLLLVELRDWFFALGALVAVAAIGVLTDGNWWLAVPTLAAFVALYLVALFASSRLLGERPLDPGQSEPSP